MFFSKSELLSEKHRKRAQSGEQKAESREQRAEQRAESREQRERAESIRKQGKSKEQRNSSAYQRGPPGTTRRLPDLSRSKRSKLFEPEFRSLGSEIPYRAKRSAYCSSPYLDLISYRLQDRSEGRYTDT